MSPDSRDPSRAPDRRSVHDVRGALNAVSLNLTLLKRAARGELDHLSDLDERRLGWIEAIQEQVDGMTALVEGWSRQTAEPADEEEGPENS